MTRLTNLTPDDPSECLLKDYHYPKSTLVTNVAGKVPMWYENKINLKDKPITRMFISKYRRQMEKYKTWPFFLNGAGTELKALCKLDNFVCSQSPPSSWLLSSMALNLKELPVLTSMNLDILICFYKTGFLSSTMTIQMHRKAILKVNQGGVTEASMSNIVRNTQSIMNDTA